MPVVVVTDSSCCLPSEIVEHYGIGQVPLHVAFDLGWLDGQAKIANEMGPDVKVADSSKKKPALSVVGEQGGQG